MGCASRTFTPFDEVCRLLSAMNASQGSMIAVVALVAAIQFSDAATVMPIKGEILVSSGTGYQRIDGEVVLKPGDSAIAYPDAQAVLVYTMAA